MTARLKPAGTILAMKPDGAYERLGSFSNLKVKVEETIDGGEEPVEFEVRKEDRYVGVRFVGLAPELRTMRELIGDDAGASEWREPHPPRMEIALHRERSHLLPFWRKEQDPGTENRKQRRAREARERRSA